MSSVSRRTIATVMLVGASWLEAIIVLIALLGLLPTDDTNPDKVEGYWLSAAVAGGFIIALLVRYLKTSKGASK